MKIIKQCFTMSLFKTGLCFLLGLFILSSSCEEIVDSDTPDCERFEEAEITFSNRSSRTAYDIIWDGSRVGTIGPGRQLTITTAAGRHTMLFQYSNNGQNACSQATPVLTACTSETFSCSSDL